LAGAENLGFVRYRICGLTVGSDSPLPELPLADKNQNGQADVRFRVREASERAAPEPRNWVTSDALDNGQPWLSCARTDAGYLVRVHDLADFFIDTAGREVSCVPHSDISARTLRHLFIDQVIPLVLNLRGQDALHATSALLAPGLCAFVGPSGVGKSTLAAAFQLAGFPVLSDDCLAVKEENGQMFAIPAYPGVRLWEDSVAALGRGDSGAIPVADYTPKRRVIAPDSSDEIFWRNWPLVRIYALVRQVAGDSGEAVESPLIEPMPRGTAFLELVASLFRLDSTDRVMLERQFRFVEKIISQVPVRRLKLPDDLALLPAVRDAIAADLKAG